MLLFFWAPICQGLTVLPVISEAAVRGNAEYLGVHVFRGEFLHRHGVHFVLQAGTR